MKRTPGTPRNAKSEATNIHTSSPFSNSLHLFFLPSLDHLRSRCQHNRCREYVSRHYQTLTYAKFTTLRTMKPTMFHWILSRPRIPNCSSHFPSQELAGKLVMPLRVHRRLCTVLRQPRALTPPQHRRPRRTGYCASSVPDQTR